MIFTIPPGQAGVGLAVTAVRRDKTTRVAVAVPAVGEGVTVTGESVPAGTVGKIVPRGTGVGVCPPQAVASARTISNAMAILQTSNSQTLRVLKTLRVF